MRIAIVSDIHGNRTAFDAVLTDLREVSPDLILHGGDLADAGASPTEIVDRICDLGWPGVGGNTDEMLFEPDSLARFASQSPQMQPFRRLIEEMAAWTRESLGEKRLAWLRALPRVQIHGPTALVHASPGSAWHAPAHESSDGELDSVYRPLEKPIAVYGHIHRPYVRELPGLTVVNTGSVGLPYDGDRRAAYLLLDDSRPSIRRVEYSVNKELKTLSDCGIPDAGWIARILTNARPEMP